MDKTEEVTISSRNKKRTILIAFMGLMIALEFVFERVFVINIGSNTRFCLTFVARAISGMCFGMLPAAVISMSADVIGSIAFYGSINPGITLACGVRGIIYGSLLRKKQTILRIIICSFLDQFVCGFIIVSVSLAFTSGVDIFSLSFYLSRLPQYLILFPLECVLLIALLPFLPRLKNTVERLSNK